MRQVRGVENLTTFMCRLSLNLGASTLLEPSGPVQACNGIAFMPISSGNLYVNKDVRIRGYFSKPKRGPLGTTFGDLTTTWYRNAHGGGHLAVLTTGDCPTTPKLTIHLYRSRNTHWKGRYDISLMFETT
jgi:hypothetical protein